MTKKELKAAQAEFHAFIKSQQKPEIEASITFMDGEEERIIPVKIKQDLTIPEDVMFVNRVMEFCRDEDMDEIYPSSMHFGFQIALLEYFTDIKERIKEDDIVSLIECFNVAEFLCENTGWKIEKKIKFLGTVCKEELDWVQRQYLNNHGVNSVFVKLENLLDKIDMAVDSASDYMGEDKLNELLDAVKTVADAPDKVAEKIIETERARVAVRDEIEN